jgi:transcriptional regulator with XRE-family HTH domain
MTMPRRRPLPPECAQALADLVGPLRARMREQGLSQAQIAIRLGRDRSRVSRALSAGEVPPRQLIDDIARLVGADPTETSGRWARADALRHKARALAAGGGPPAGLTSYPDLLGALRELLRARGISQRDLAQRAGLPRSTIGAALRGERSAQHHVVVAIVRACGVTTDAEHAWSATWWRLGSPHQQERRRNRYEGYRYAIDRGMLWI